MGKRVHTIFVYGTLTDTGAQQQAIGRIFRGQMDILEKHQLSTMDDSGVQYPVVIREKMKSVFGRRISVDGEELKKIDAYEGPAYRRILYTLKSGTPAWVYVGKDYQESPAVRMG